MEIKPPREPTEYTVGKERVQEGMSKIAVLLALKSKLTEGLVDVTDSLNITGVLSV